MKTLDLLECAEFLKIDRTHALKLAGDGKLPGAKIGRSWVFLEEDLAEYLRNQVKMQQRQRMIDAEVELGLPIPGNTMARNMPRSPMAGRRSISKQKPNLDLYDLPEPVSEIAAA